MLRSEPEPQSGNDYNKEHDKGGYPANGHHEHRKLNKQEGNGPQYREYNGQDPDGTHADFKIVKIDPFQYTKKI